MDLMQVMNGKITYRAAYVAMAAGVYLIAYQVGDMLDLPAAMETRRIIAEVLRGQGFYTLLGGVALFGLRRAMAKGGLAEPEEKELTPEEQKARLQEMLDEFTAIIEKQKEPK